MERSSIAQRPDPTTWVDTHGEYLYRFALAKVRQVDVAEDLVQETLLAALAARKEFRGQSSERSWLTGILKRKVVDWFRTRVRVQVRQKPLDDQVESALFTQWGKWKTAPGAWATDDPSSATLREEFWSALTRCLDGLPARLRDVFVLRHLDEETLEALSRKLEATTTNVGVMLHRARLRLWRCPSVRWFQEDN